MKVAVIGGGVAGLSAAYFLAKAGADVKVFEQKYLLYGASGRNSGGLTAQFTNEAMIKLAKRTLELYDELQSEVGFNFLLRRDGYVKIAGKGEEAKLREEVEFQRKAGVKVKMVEPEFVKELFPDINTSAFTAASYFADGGVVFPWPVVWGLAKGCRELGVEIYDYTPASVEVKGNDLTVKASGESYKVDYIINAAGAWSNEISQQAGVELNNKVFREEICVTESLKPYLDPYIMDISTGVYFSQSMRGEIVGGILGSETDRLETKASLDFLTTYAKRVTELVPKLRGMAVLRQWAGLYDAGRNGMPVIGQTKVRGFIQLNGFGRHGMSLALAAGEGVAELIVKGRSSIVEPFKP
ncbi:NAD(P)/FAD-dependent oxidoreductase [Archaeoglobus fulgidus]|jgi:sarcosine oxidase subunit beta|uniref:Sarcosine oxidase, subunit beta (SoxB) n=3 Tax=Archaeoglobus fulgidus TaxID=2234 RepID=O29965_ARCFU|nr:FAD-binding oxidoreductase [Archaeoglobus fulgidus]AAB90958.1 sarcosine oxidase, subunit beta (soxB) [Archaeoglobus fulgidus DSM 4304]AIG97095.1 Glycine/D-amino acid oxidase (deaminating) [Archaeoglobus fulgidus DSM 8774]KUJ94485.1 MAG: Sarcosine oxidase, subunit beta (SoxB) [Archaeoglobus fulgidus]KUK07663.1 MAG: Sarcosine oxidase, subunit beta (SoxB) [Archaeoglobus fulgidus]